MGFFDRLKDAAKRLGRGFANVIKPDRPTIAVHPSTSEEVRQGLRSTGAEVVETKPLPAAKPTLAERMLRQARYRQGYVLGETFDIGINKVKRRIKAMPKRERRAARTAFIQQLRASGVKN